MADNVPITAGSGTTIRTNESGGVHTQVVQIAGGDDASTHFLLTGAGASGSGVLRVNLASDDPAVAALETLDNFIETDRGAVNLIVGQAGVAGGAGAVSAATSPVISARSSFRCRPVRSPLATTSASTV